MLTWEYFYRAKRSRRRPLSSIFTRTPLLPQGKENSEREEKAENLRRDTFAANISRFLF